MSKNAVSPEPTASAAPVSPAFRRYLYVTAATTGGVVMIVEILGAKLLAPYTGTSHFVWTAQIAVTLGALAAGYYLGGRLADKDPAPGRLYACILAAAAYLCFSAFLVRPVANGCLSLGLAGGTLLASTVLFLFPIASLAMTAPFLTRLITTSLAGVGGTVGRLTAVSTAGSLAGTLLIGYVLVPLLPNTRSLFLAAGYFLIWRRTLKNAVRVAGLLALAYFPVTATRAYEGLNPWHRSAEVYRGNSNFGLIQVIDYQYSSLRLCLNDYLLQNTWDTREQKSVSPFTYMLYHLARAYRPHLDSALCIGLGAGLVPRQLAEEGVRVEAVEINPQMIKVARQFFGCRPELFPITAGDGRYFLARDKHHYQAVILDAFLGDAVPAHLMTVEAFTAIRERLAPGGVLVINSFGCLEPGRDFSTASLDKTLRRVFPFVRLHAATQQLGNIYFVASAEPHPAAPAAPDFSGVHRSVRAEVEKAFSRTHTTDPNHGRVLTDDYNPVEFYDAANREQFRRTVTGAVSQL
jgi:spermidine synthase